IFPTSQPAPAPHTLSLHDALPISKPSLTQRELDVLQLVAQGRSNKDIARRLAITEGTAKTHVKAILTKLDAISRTEAVAVAHKRSEEHTSELQSPYDLVCRLLLEK